jgi:FMN phosphatase YigB (HAD superfamily)
METESEAIVFDLDGTLVEGLPYEEILENISRLADTPYDELFTRYTQNWQGLKEAQDYHVTLVGDAYASKVHSLYRTFTESKGRQTILPGAVDVLTFARKQNKYLVCWTQGDSVFQRLGLPVPIGGLFNDIVVIPNKNTETVNQFLLPALVGRSFTMVGDSYKQDMLPVKDVARERIWITESKANAYSAPPKDIDSDIRRIRTISDLLNG